MDDRRPTIAIDSRGSFIRESVLPYLGVRPIGFLNSLRLYAGYSIALCGRGFRPSAESAVGAVVPGRSLLTVSFLDIMAQVRPGTNDLDLLVHHEPKTLSWFRVGAGEVVVDVGAHIGRYTLLAAKSGAKVISIEPDPSNFQLLESNVRLNRFNGVALYRVALSNAAGVRELILSSGTNRGTSFVTNHGRSDPSCQTSERIPVDCITLDDLSDAEGLRRIDWLKIDVEGHESEVLEGAVRSLRNTKNLILEVTAGNEQACRRRLDQAEFDLKAVEPGYPSSNWLLVKVS